MSVRALDSRQGEHGHGDRDFRQLGGPTTLPVGFGGEEPRISRQKLQRGDRVLCFTDGLIEEHEAGEEQFIHWVNRIEHTEKGVRAVVRSLSHALKRQRGGRTTDDATLFLTEWRGGAAEHLAPLE
jgi:serine phosphatase RsbU (regulator of sigma subunit)